VPFSIRLEQDMVNQLTGIAVRSHRRMSDVVKEALEIYIAGQAREGDARTSPYNRIAHLIGCIDGGGVTRSVDTGRIYAAALKERSRARRAR
jgi:hypothetical protein